MSDIHISGSFQPTTTNTPLDVRTVVNTEADIQNINLPYVGMLIYAKDTNEMFIVNSLKAGTLNNKEVPEYLVDTYTKMSSADGSLSEDQKNELLDELEDRLLNGEWGTV